MAPRACYAAIVGVPNVGKSTLLNCMVGAKIAITSPKPQTTRSRIMGVLTRGELQLVFLDTPGFLEPRTRLGEHMLKTVRDSVAEIDCALFVTWAKDSFDPLEQKLLDELRAAKVPALLVVNKTDTLKEPQKAAAALAALGALYPFVGQAAVSAATGAGVEALFALLDARSAEEPHMFPDDTLTDVPEKVLAAEMIREQLLRHLRDELPHGCAVSVERFRERPDSDILDIDAEILCEKESHKGMIIGKGGAMLKTIGTDARADIEQFLGCRVNLQLWVKVRENWRDKESILRGMGY